MQAKINKNSPQADWTDQAPAHRIKEKTGLDRRRSRRTAEAAGDRRSGEVYGEMGEEGEAEEGGDEGEGDD